MSEFVQAIGPAFSPYYLLLVFSGAFIGILVGAMPGLSSVMGLTIVLPFTFTIDGVGGIFMLLGIFCGAIYGGSITAILINTPGTANSAATTLDGYPMATKLGQPGRALSISTMASTFGGLFSAVALLWTSPLLAKVVLNFASPEYFALAMFGLSIVTRVSSASIIKSLMGAVFGLLLATVGLDMINGVHHARADERVFRGAGAVPRGAEVACRSFSQKAKRPRRGASGVPKRRGRGTRLFPRLRPAQGVVAWRIANCCGN